MLQTICLFLMTVLYWTVLESTIGIHLKYRLLRSPHGVNCTPCCATGIMWLATNTRAVLYVTCRARVTLETQERGLHQVLIFHRWLAVLISLHRQRRKIVRYQRCWVIPATGISCDCCTVLWWWQYWCDQNKTVVCQIFGTTVIIIIIIIIHIYIVP